MPTMTNAEREQFLADVHVGVIAVERPSRAPLAVPVWYYYETGGEVLVWTDIGSVKERLIRAAGRFSFTVQVEQPPYRYVTAEGPVTAIDPATAEVARLIATRYLGDDAGAAFAEQSLTAKSVVIRMSPEQWLSSDYSKE